jgi:nucleoside-diphosphate-sugar epimerase
MRILVTGGGGFLGTYIVRELLKRSHFIVTNFSRNNYSHLEEMGVPTIKGDIRKKDDVHHALKQGFDAIIHVASLCGDWGRHQDFLETNFFGTQNLINAAKENGIKYFVYTSTSSVVLQNDDLLGVDEDFPYPKKFLASFPETKAMAERLVLQSNDNQGFLTSVLRPDFIWGPGDPYFLPSFIHKAKKEKLKIVGDGENLVDCIYVENAAEAHVQLLEAMMSGTRVCGQAYFIGQERPIKLWDFISQILSQLKIKSLADQVDFDSAYRMAWVLEKTFKIAGIQRPHPPLTRFMVCKLGRSHYFSHQRARNDFAYTPKISIEEGLKRTFAIREQIKLSIKD